MEYELKFTLFFHFIGLALLGAVSFGGMFIERHYRNAGTLQEKAVVLGLGKKLGMMSPVAMLILLVSGVGNMHALGYGIFTLGWLTAKIMFFAIAAVGGGTFAVISAKRGKLVGRLAKGEQIPNGAELLAGFNKQVTLFYFVLPLLMMIIIALASYGSHGGGQN
jgi:uncharacterized membrane protein